MLAVPRLRCGGGYFTVLRLARYPFVQATYLMWLKSFSFVSEF